MREILGRELDLSDVEDRIIARFAEVFEMRPEEKGADGRRQAAGGKQ
jgi:hypothetical protein